MFDLSATIMDFQNAGIALKLPFYGGSNYNFCGKKNSSLYGKSAEWGLWINTKDSFRGSEDLESLCKVEYAISEDIGII